MGEKPNRDEAKAIDLNRYDFATREGRARFIAEMESSLYGGTNVDKEAVLVFQQQNVGMEVWTIHHAKPRWYEVVHYDSVGNPEGVTYEPVK